MNIVCAPLNLGLKKKPNDTEPGVKYFPETLLQSGFATALGVEEITILEAPGYQLNIDAESGIRNADAIAQYSLSLSQIIISRLRNAELTIVIGGDCSILLGTSLALKQSGNYGLFYLDGHTDYMLVEHSETKAAAGMDLALVTGHGHGKLSNLMGLSPYFEENNIYAAGNREFTPWYTTLIEESSIHYFDLNACRQKTFTAVAAEFLLMLKTKKLDGFWIHFDVDALHDDIMPCVDSRTADGLTYAEFADILTPLLSSDQCRGIEITIFDPSLDHEGTYLNTFSKAMEAIFIAAGLA